MTVREFANAHGKTSQSVYLLIKKGRLVVDTVENQLVILPGTPWPPHLKRGPKGKDGKHTVQTPDPQPQSTPEGSGEGIKGNVSHPGFTKATELVTGQTGSGEDGTSPDLSFSARKLIVTGSSGKIRGTGKHATVEIMDEFGIPADDQTTTKEG